MSKTSTFVRMQNDGTLVRIKPDGAEEKTVVHPPTPLSDEAVTAAALRDPDAQPLTEADLARMKRVPCIKTLRRALGLTQEEFAARYHIPLGTLRDWEQGRCEPDQPARAYLTAIAHDPEGVQRALQAGPHQPVLLQEPPAI
jgi:putative transcriptional regulator